MIAEASEGGPRIGPRVCILTPGQIGSNPRVVKEAQALHEAGYRVQVVATRILDQVEPRDRALMRRISWQLDRIDMTRRYVWRTRRLAQEASRRAFAATGFGCFADFGFSAFTSALYQQALDIPADLYIAHYPAALPAAAAAARRHDGLYAFDAEDFHYGDAPDERAKDLEKRLIHAIEGRYLPAAAYMSAASPGISDAYAAIYGVARPTVVLNAFPRANAPAMATPSGKASPGPSVYWFSQTIGPGRGLEMAISAISCAASRPHLFLRGSLAEGYERQLLGLAQHEGVSDRLHFLEPAAPDDMERLAADYDVGYSGETGFSKNNELALGNKLFSYLTGGIPILASDVDAHRRIAPGLGAAITLFPLGDMLGLAAAMDQYLLDPSRLAAARQCAWRLGQERYCWEAEQGSLLKAVAGAFAMAGCRPGPTNQA